MKRLLIVSPHFPPTNAPDMQRVRMSAPFYEEFGWTPQVLAVDPAAPEHARDPDLERSLPHGLAVTRVAAMPARLTRKVGVGNVALRALPFLYAAGRRMLRAQRCDLVFFSTTMFPAMTLGRIWKREFGVPYVVDMQDPWATSYYEDNPTVPRPPKYRLAHALDKVLERWTMETVDGVMAVSTGYIDTLCARYPSIGRDRCLTLPFGASERDFQVLPTLALQNRVFGRDDDALHGVYAGRVTDAMGPALRVLFGALRKGRSSMPDSFGRVRLHFVGTDYATGRRARPSVEPIARECGVADWVSEQTERVGYFETLKLLQDADFLVVLGSDDVQYSPSKIYPCVLARRPVLGVLHARSSAADLLRNLRAGVVATFGGGEDTPAATLVGQWAALLGMRCPPDADWAQFVPYTAREMTRRQCELFDAVTQATSCKGAERQPCAGGAAA